MIIEIFVPQAESKQPLPQQLFNRVLDPALIPVIAKTLRQARNQSGSLFNFPQ